MGYAHQYLSSAQTIISSYNGDAPLAVFLKQYFSLNKKHGSRDRKEISHACYCYYRLGQALKELSPPGHAVRTGVEEKLKTALFLCNDQPAGWKELFDGSWIENWSEDLKQRIQFLKLTQPSFSTDDIVKWREELSGEINADAFSISHLIQPNLFIRIRPGNEKIVVGKLKEASIAFEQISSSCLSLPNTSKIDTVLALDKEAVVQDHSSQLVADFFPVIDSKNTIHLWDCCAGSGGKSILAIDTLNDVQLAVSDIRSSILQNLHERFQHAGIKNYRWFVANLSGPKEEALPLGPGEGFNFILCDAPCSGSGTWGRTPEQLSFFTKEKIAHYSNIQKKIVSRVIPHLEKEGYFLYITCSVFKKENEDIASFIESEFPVQLIKKGLIVGYDKKADTMYAALYRALPV